jgi:hypothetical protein
MHYQCTAARKYTALADMNMYAFLRLWDNLKTKTMMRHFPTHGTALLSGLLFAITASATSVPRLTFEEMTDRSELVVSGQITRTWSGLG